MTPSDAHNSEPEAEPFAKEKRIRERAYHLWQSEGGTHDRHPDEYWHSARELIELEEETSHRPRGTAQQK